MKIKEFEAIGWKISYMINYENENKPITYIQYTARTFTCVNHITIYKEVFERKSIQSLYDMRTTNIKEFY